MAEKSTSRLQSLGNGAYRVTGVRVSPVTGRYLTGSGAPSRVVVKRPNSGGSSTTKSSKS